jgi:predicted RNase H-like HicB family nuclease
VEETLLFRILRGQSDANIRFDDLRKLLKDLGFQERIRGSHHVFVRLGIEQLINLQREGSFQAVPGSAGSVRDPSVSPRGPRLMHKYKLIIFWSEEDQVFIAEVPELPGCAGHGDSPESALASCEEAIGLWLDTAKEFGRLIPEPKGSRLQLA